jgi:hypothetical protein
LAAYEPHAEALQRFYRSIEARFKRTDVGREESNVAEWEAKFDGQNYLFSGRTDSVKNSNGDVASRGRPTIEGQNRLYSFGLIANAEGEYSIRSVTMTAPGTKQPLSILSVPIADFLRGYTYLETAHDEGTRIICFEDRVWRAQPMKELRVHYTQTFPGSKESFHKDVSYYFSAEEGWICRGQRWWDERDTKQFVAETVYLYEIKQEQEFPSLKRIEGWIDDDKDPSRLKRNYWLDFAEFRRDGPFPETDFRLSAFGLPEPQGIEWPKPSRTWIWLLIGAAAAAVLAVVFARAKRRLLKNAA